MARLLVYFAHPGRRHSRANAGMEARARTIADITYIDLYAEYPRFEIDVEQEQERLLAHDVILFQFPLFWYSTPALVKEWQDLVLEHGFAYGAGGDHLAGKRFSAAITAAGPEDAYQPKGYQHYPIRTFLTPLEQTARLCRMRFFAPYVLFGSLRAAAQDDLGPHIAGYARLLEALRDDRFDFDQAERAEVLSHETLPLIGEG